MGNIIEQTERLKRQGLRRLMVVSGEAQWCQLQAQQWISLLPGDWLWIGDAPQTPLNCKPSAAKTLLGQEFLHAVFDARDGFHAEALAVLAGTLKAGSWLVILAPEWESWPTQPDLDSLRWSETSAPIATPNFIHRLQKRLLADEQVALLRQHHAPVLPSPPATPEWQPDDTSQQQQVLQQLLRSDPGISVLIAPRGRGKSALAGTLAARWRGRCLISAPAKVATDVLAKFAGDAFEFIAPDRLLALTAAERPENIDWLVIDEAAAIPTPMLHQLVHLYPRVLLTTTLQGYEGTGRGFLLKFCASLPEATILRLAQPLRWSQFDPLERFIDDTPLFSEAEPIADERDIDFSYPQQNEWQGRATQLEAMYRLLTSAHYRTSPLDLRRMMDAPGMHFSAALQGDQVQGALWLVDEGGLSAGLAEAVWAGLRRPAGNLVAQSLAAHGGWPEAATLASRRISRIAISPALRQRGIGRQMIQQSLGHAEGLDFLSVSFGYTEVLWRFWQACGFQLVRFGTKPEASSGCYTAMAILPLSEAGRALAEKGRRKLARDWPWLRPQLRDVDLALTLTASESGAVNKMDEDDWRDLAGFAWAHRPFEASIGALGRLVSNDSRELPLLQGAVLERLSPTCLIQQSGLSGRKALLAGWRQETQRAMNRLDPQRSANWQRYIAILLQNQQC
ncbi:tRNA(Met) cytidine acetyltransferase TmcA [Pantoea sp. CCBC3-3-1]|uniref:tRNA(Met) cytidine acetyltransferase TmcA n=1 Tax=Pantoea sp. CCBC3-3-1 TaxID=2490851 RepID=UPI0011BE90C1|nr:GNAT family N-acetyltransferase [Pantoea sp. CCBC3-3-1]